MLHSPNSDDLFIDDNFDLSMNRKDNYARNIKNLKTKNNNKNQTYILN